MSTSKRIYAFLSDRLNALQACVLVTVTDVTGASVIPRAVRSCAAKE